MEIDISINSRDPSHFFKIFIKIFFVQGSYIEKDNQLTAFENYIIYREI